MGHEELFESRSMHFDSTRNAQGDGKCGKE